MFPYLRTVLAKFAAAEHSSTSTVQDNDEKRRLPASKLAVRMFC